MSMLPISSLRPRADELAALREAVARVAASRGPVLPFGVGPLDHLLAGGGLDGAGLHEVAGASASWSDDAAATLFAAGIAARFAAAPGVSALWALTRFDLYAPGLEQAGLGPDRVLYAQPRRRRRHHRRGQRHRPRDGANLSGQGLAGRADRPARGCAARWFACLRHRRGKGGGPDGDTAAAARGIRGQHAHAALPSLSALRPMSARRSVARDDPLAHWNAAVGAPRIAGRRTRALVGRARPPARRAAFLPRTGGVR